MRLEELASVARGVVTTKDNLKPSGGEAYLVVQIRHIQEGTIAPAVELKTVYLNPNTKPGRFTIKPGDILVAMVGAKAKVVLLDEVPNKILADKNVAIIRPTSAAAGTRIAKYLTSETGQKALRSLQTGAVIAHVKMSDLQSINIP